MVDLKINLKKYRYENLDFTEDEIVKLAKAEIGVYHCPTAYKLLYSGASQVTEMEASWVSIGFGVKDSSSNYFSYLFNEIRMGLLFQRLHFWPKVRNLDALRWSPERGANVLKVVTIGRNSEGMQAYLSIF